MANSPTYVTATIGAENTFSDALTVRGNRPHKISFSLEGSWTATVHLQCRRKDSSNWIDIASRTSNDAVEISLQGEFDYRFGVKSGNYGTGSVIGVLSARQTIEGGEDAS